MIRLGLGGVAAAVVALGVAGGVAGGAAAQGDPQQALQGLAQIRQQQCQMGNQLACQALPAMSAVQQQLTQAGQGCRSGNQQACATYNQLSQRIFTSYAESAQVMQQGAQGMAQINAWRGQMNSNHANNMAALGAQAAAGQAAHQARQDGYAAQNQAWAAGQASQARGHGRYVDSIYGGTTMNGGGVQTFVPYGQTGYTDGYGNVATGQQGAAAPYGWQEMTPTYEAPE